MSNSDEHRESAIETMARYLYPDAFNEDPYGQHWQAQFFGDKRTTQERMAEARLTARVKVEMALDQAEPHLRTHFREQIANELTGES